LDAVWQLGVYYFIPCIAIAAIVSIAWVRRQFTNRPPSSVRRFTSEKLDLCQQVGKAPVAGRFARLMSLVPGNQAFWLSIERREVEFGRLPSALDGLSIVHLSDFHFTGRISPQYFHEVVDRANAREPDLIAITGDLVDHAACFAWLPDTLGRLRAKVGVFFILGNHDLRTRDVGRLRGILTDLGLTDLGGRWKNVAVRGESLLLAGNELPWIAPAADMRTCVAAAVGMERDRPFRILLAHSPDQFGWARRWDFDLVLAGHTHGGQFCLPGIGPLLTPSWHGVQYSAGTFFAGQTLMHVSRGTSSELPLRWNCLPELGEIVLRTAGSWDATEAADATATRITFSA
jgi:uncharacterized protein